MGPVEVAEVARLLEDRVPGLCIVPPSELCLAKEIEGETLRYAVGIGLLETAIGLVGMDLLGVIELDNEHPERLEVGIESSDLKVDFG